MKKFNHITLLLLTAACMLSACSGKKVKTAESQEETEARARQESMLAAAIPESDLPKPAAGETLYLGEAQFSKVGKFQLAFLLSADKSEVYKVTTYIRDLQYSYQKGSSVTNATIGNSRLSTFSSYPVSKEGTNISFGKSMLTGLTFTESGATATISYVYIDSNGAEEVAIPLGTAEISFNKQ